MNTVELFKKYMIEKHSENLGPDFGKVHDPYNDLYRALAVLIADTCRHEIGLEEIPKKVYCKLVMCNASEYYKQILQDEVVLREFDHIYETMVNTWNGNFDDIEIRQVIMLDDEETKECDIPNAE